MEGNSRRCGKISAISACHPPKTLGNRQKSNRNPKIAARQQVFQESAKDFHAVFSVSRSEVLPLLDEAWLSVQAQGLETVQGDTYAYVVNMGRVIGTAGETNLRLVIEPGTSKVITAYPVP